MYYGMYMAAAGAAAQSRRMEVVSHNIANVATPGFKREMALMRAEPMASQSTGQYVPGSPFDLGGGVRVAESVTDFTLGPLRDTGNDTDFALERPDEFFSVEKDGKEYLTRAGSFHLTQTGQLVTDQGYPVLSAEGGPVQLDPTFPFSVSDKGDILQGGGAIPLSVKRATNLGDLTRVGENLFRSVGAAPTPVPLEQRSVRWQHLEMSAVQPQREMVQMIETSRAYEANVRIIQNHDSILSSLIGRLMRA
jgi:flagellar basal-body rod protein FlgF